MNLSRVLSVLVVLVAVVVLVVALVFFFEKKNKAAKDEETAAETAKAEAEVAKVLNVVTFLRNDKVEELKAVAGAFLLDARATSGYTFQDKSVAVVPDEVPGFPGYKKFTHTLPTPFKGASMVFDAQSKHEPFQDPVSTLTAYFWHHSLLFLTFTTVGTGEGVTRYFHYTSVFENDTLSWTRFEANPNTPLDVNVLGPKLNELNTKHGNAVLLSLDEFLEPSTGSYTTELGGVRTTFQLSKRPYSQTGFFKVTHKLVAGEVARPFKLANVEVSGSELTELTLPSVPVVSVSVFWWYTMPLLADVELLSGAHEHFVYNVDTNNWYNETVEAVRSRLNVMKNKLGVPLTLQLDKRPSAHDETYTTNDVMVRVGPPERTAGEYTKHTHTFPSGNFYFVGAFTNAGSPQMGLPVVRVNEVSVYFSGTVPSLLKLNLASTGGLSTTFAYYSNNGFGFWSSVPLDKDLATTDAVLKKLSFEKRQLVASNNKYVVDVAAKTDYLSVGKPLTVVKETVADLPGYQMFHHKLNNNAPFTFEKLSLVGRDVNAANMAPVEHVAGAKVYWFLEYPLMVQLHGTRPAPVRTGESVPNPPHDSGAFELFFLFDANTNAWSRAEKPTGVSVEPLKALLAHARSRLGSVPLDLGLAPGTHAVGPVTVTVLTDADFAKRNASDFEKTVHELSAPFPLGKVKNFDFDLKLTMQNGGGTGETRLFSLVNLVAKGMDVYSYRNVPLVFKLKLEGDADHFFFNNLVGSTWTKFAPDSHSNVLVKLNELKRQMTGVLSMDVCKKLSGESFTYELPFAVGDAKVNVTVAKVASPGDGLTALSHTLSADNVKLSALFCGDKLLTGLTMDPVKTVYVYYRGDTPVLVKTNSDPKYYVFTGRGGLSHHALPAGAPDLNPAQVGELVNQTAAAMGPVLPLNLAATANYSVEGVAVRVTTASLGRDMNFVTHTLTTTEPSHFTVSKYVVGNVDAVGLPKNETNLAVYVGLKGAVPYLVGVKAKEPVKFRWYVFDKHRWLYDFETDELLDDSDSVAVLEDVLDGLDNEFDLDLSPDVHHDAFNVDVHEYKEQLLHFTMHSFAPKVTKYPFLLSSLWHSYKVLEVPVLPTKHLVGFAAYTFHNLPVFLHAYTMDNVSLFFHNTFEGPWEPFEFPEYNDETLKAKLLALKKLALDHVTLDLAKKVPYSHLGATLKVVAGDAPPEGFLKFVHTFPGPVVGDAGAAANLPFNVAAVSFNGHALDVALPKGTVPGVDVFLNADNVPLGFYLNVSTEAKAAPEPPVTTPPTPKPKPAAPVVTHHYFFNNAGVFKPLVGTAAPLEAPKLKEKLVAAEKTLGFVVDVDLGKKFPYVFTKEVPGTSADAAATTKTVDFLVTLSPRDFFKFSNYAHVPQVRVTKDKTLVTEDFPAFVKNFKVGNEVQSGFDFALVSSFTVFWLDDTKPFFVHLQSGGVHKLFRFVGDAKWVLVKVLPSAPDDAVLFHLLTLAKEALAWGVRLELSAGAVPNNWDKYSNNGLAVKVVKPGHFHDDFKMFMHTSASHFAPTFKLLGFNLPGLVLLDGAAVNYANLGFVSEVRVYTDVDGFPLLAEVASSKHNNPKSQKAFTYFTFKRDDNFGFLVDFPQFTPTDATAALEVKFLKARLEKPTLVALLTHLKTAAGSTVVVKLDAVAPYNAKTGETVAVVVADKVLAGTTPTTFKVYTHTLPAPVKSNKTAVLTLNGKKVAYVAKDAGFETVEVYSLKEVPVLAKFNWAVPNPSSHHVFMDRDWSFKYNLWPEYVPAGKPVDEVLPKVLDYHTVWHSLDVGKKKLYTHLGVSKDLELVEYRHENFELPEFVVGYSLLPTSEHGYKVNKLEVFGLDFKEWGLALPVHPVFHAHVYSPDAFYAPLFLELVSKSTPARTDENANPVPVDHFHYYYATGNGRWVALDTAGKKVDLAHLALRLSSFVYPEPVAVDFGRLEGKYGLNEVVVTRTLMVSTYTFTKYTHKLVSGDKFNVAKFVFGGLLVNKLPMYQVDLVSVYFMEDAVPLLVELVSGGQPVHYVVDGDGDFLPELVSRTAVSSFLKFLVDDLVLVAHVSNEVVPHLNNKFLREFELVPPAPVVAPKAPAPASATPPTQPSTPVAKPGTAPADAPRTQGDTQGVTTVALASNRAGNVAPGTVVEGGSTVTRQETSAERSVAPQVSAVGPAAAAAAAKAAAAGPQVHPPPATPPKPATATVGNVERVPALPSTAAAENVAGAASGVVPLAPPVPAPKKVRREFKLAVFDYDKVFHGYFTMGKFVKVTRFDDVPSGFNLARHWFVLDKLKYFFNKFTLGDKKYVLPPVPAESPDSDRMVKSLAFYSFLEKPLMLKLAYHSKKPVYYTYSHTNDNFVHKEVVNLEEDLEVLNHTMHNAYSFDLGRPLGRHNYFNEKFYYLARGPSQPEDPFVTVDAEALVRDPEAEEKFRGTLTEEERNRPGFTVERYKQVTFKLGKLRFGTSDLPVTGLPVDKEFTTLRVFFSKKVDKPLLLVLFDDDDESERKSRMRKDPLLYLGYHYHLHPDGFWAFFVPTGEAALHKKVLELEPLFLEKPALDLAFFPTASAPLAYKTKHDDFVAERVFVPSPRAVVSRTVSSSAPSVVPPRPATPLPNPPASPPTATGQTPPPGMPPTPPQQQEAPASPPPGAERPHVAATASLVGGPAASPSPAVSTAGEPVSRSTPSTTPLMPAVVDPVAGLKVVTGQLPAGPVFVEVPLVPFMEPVGLEAEVGFEMFVHHTPYFVHTVPVPAPQPPQKPAPSVPAPQEVKRTVKTKKFHLGRVLFGGVELDFEAPFEEVEAVTSVTVFKEKGSRYPFAFALFNARENSPDPAKADYVVYVHKNLKWVKTDKLNDFFELMRTYELRLDLESFDAVVGEFYNKLHELALAAKEPMTYRFSLDLAQDDLDKQEGMAVLKEADPFATVDMLKVVYTPRVLPLTKPSDVNFTLDFVSVFGYRYMGLKLPLVGVVEVVTYYRNTPEKVKRMPVVLEVLQKVVHMGKNVVKHHYYVYDGSNNWKLHLSTVNRLEDHEVYELVNSRLYALYRVSTYLPGALDLDFDAKFSHMSRGRFVDAHEFYHDPSPHAALSPVPAGFVLYRHSMLTDKTMFTVPFFKLHGMLKPTPFKQPLVEYFFYSKFGSHTPFVVVLATAERLDPAVKPKHHWYFFKEGDWVKFAVKGDTDVDPDDPSNKDVVAKKFAELLKAEPAPVAGDDPLKAEPTAGQVPPMPVMPDTDPAVLSRPENGVRSPAREEPLSASGLQPHQPLQPTGPQLQAEQPEDLSRLPSGEGPELSASGVEDLSRLGGDGPHPPGDSLGGLGGVGGVSPARGDSEPGSRADDSRDLGQESPSPDLGQTALSPDPSQESLSPDLGHGTQEQHVEQQQESQVQEQHLSSGSTEDYGVDDWF